MVFTSADIIHIFTKPQAGKFHRLICFHRKHILLLGYQKAIVIPLYKLIFTSHYLHNKEAICKIPLITPL